MLLGSESHLSPNIMNSEILPENFTAALIDHRPLNSHGFTLCHAVSLPFSQSHNSFFTSHSFTNFEWIFSQTHSFLKKQTQAAHSNVNKECISSMVNKNKTSICSSLSLN